MDTLIFLCIVAAIAFLVAWFVNMVIGWMSGEHPGDTGRQFGDIFFRILGVCRLGYLGRILDAVGVPARWIIYVAGGVAIALLLLRSCSHARGL